MRMILAALLCTVAFPAMAGEAHETGDSYGPRGKSTYTDGRPYSRPAPVSARGVPSWVDTPWGYYGQGTNGYVDPSPSDMKRIIIENNLHARLTYDAVIDSGGCGADFIPFWIAAHCGSQAFGGGQAGQFGSAGGD